jgi:hypothetical protein
VSAGEPRFSMAETLLARVGTGALCIASDFERLSPFCLDAWSIWAEGGRARRFYHRAVEGHVPEINDAAHLRERAVNFRRLAKDYDEAGQHPVSDKLTEVAVDFDAQAAKLESNKASGVSVTRNRGSARRPSSVAPVSSKV